MVRAKPYVGVTGVATNAEVEAVLHAFDRAEYSMNSSHLPMIGYLVSVKTLRNQEVANRRYPKMNQLESLVTSARGKALTMMHYNSRDHDTLADQIRSLFEGIYQEDLCRALQLNVVWPPLDEVKKIKETFPKMKIVLQVSRSMLGKTSADNAAKQVVCYSDYVTYVLIDPSMGSGLAFNTNEAVALYGNLHEAMPQTTIGFAGGFTGENVESRVEELKAKIGTSDFSIDAESGLRDKRSQAYGDDDLNLQKVQQYIAAVGRVLP